MFPPWSDILKLVLNQGSVHSQTRGVFIHAGLMVALPYFASRAVHRSRLFKVKLSCTIYRNIKDQS